MVTIIGHKQVENEQGQPFNVLQLQGEVETVRSKNSGNLYLTARKAQIPSTFDEASCEKLIGSELPGIIERVDCEPYEYEIPESGEKIILEHTYQYNPSPVTIEEEVFDDSKQPVSI